MAVSFLWSLFFFRLGLCMVTQYNMYDISGNHFRIFICQIDGLSSKLPLNYCGVLFISLCEWQDLSVAFYRHLVQEPVCGGESDRFKVHLLGFDLDEALIQRAQQTNPLPSSISFIPLDITTDADRLQDYLNQHGCSRFHLCLCLAVTMWVHLNHGDSGLLQLLSRLASISQYLLLEAQPWKCYRSAARRLRKLGRSDFDHFKTLKIRGDIAEHARMHLERDCGMELMQSFGSTTWDRKLLLFRRRWDGVTVSCYTGAAGRWSERQNQIDTCGEWEEIGLN